MKIKWLILVTLVAVLSACSSLKNSHRKPTSETKKQDRHHHWGYDQSYRHEKK